MVGSPRQDLKYSHDINYLVLELGITGARAFSIQKCGTDQVDALVIFNPYLV
jgi:hypothetical protein